MSLKAARLLFISVLLLSVLSAASVFLRAHGENVSLASLDLGAKAVGSSSIVVVGDPVGGGIPCGIEKASQIETLEV